MEKTPYEPTGQSVRTALTLLGMLRGSLQTRNPTLVETRRAVRQFQTAANKEASTLPTTHCGKILTQMITGVTGTGKTILMSRKCELLPQKIIHGRCAEANWEKLTQLVYLYCDMSHDGSRSGFLEGLLMAMDMALGTSHLEDLSKKKLTIEKLVVRVVALLHSHYTGLVLVDELQLRNLVDSKQAKQMQTFLLKVINSGIPLVFVGNPLAFGWVDDFSQDVRRLYQKPPEYFHPAGSCDSGQDDWEDISAGILRYYVLLGGIQDKQACSAELQRCSGGIAGLALSLWCTAQRRILLSGGPEILTPAHITEAYLDEGYDKQRTMADGFTQRDPAQLSLHRDVPHRYYGRRWGKLAEATPAVKQERRMPELPEGNERKDSAAPGRPKKTYKAKLSAEETRKRNRKKKIEEISQTAAPDDARVAGLTKLHIEGLETLEKTARQGGFG